MNIRQDHLRIVEEQIGDYLGRHIHSLQTKQGSEWTEDDYHFLSQRPLFNHLSAPLHQYTQDILTICAQVQYFVRANNGLGPINWEWIIDHPKQEVKDTIRLYADCLLETLRPVSAEAWVQTVLTPIAEDAPKAAPGATKVSEEGMFGSSSQNRESSEKRELPDDADNLLGPAAKRQRVT